MDAKEFLKQLHGLPTESRAAYSATVLTLSKLSAAEAVEAMLGDVDFAVRINAIKAIRKHTLDLYEKQLIELLLDKEREVQVAAAKTLCSFGKPEHFKLIRAFFEEYPHVRALLIDSFVNFSDTYEAHSFIFSQLDCTDERIAQTAQEWFDKALDRDILLPWVADVYEEAPLALRFSFEKLFGHKLDRLFDHPRLGYRFKLVSLAQRQGL
jgi:hypothetical protein